MKNDESKGAKHAAPHDPEDLNGTIDVRVPDNHARLRFEEEKNCTLIRSDQLKAYGYWGLNFYGKLQSIARYGNIDAMFLIASFEEDPQRLRVYFYSNDHQFSISVHLPETLEFMDSPDGDPSSYMGAVLSDRKPYPGEVWTRGNDLPDGKYCDATWNTIITRIISSELKNLHLKV